MLSDYKSVFIEISPFKGLLGCLINLPLQSSLLVTSSEPAYATVNIWTKIKLISSTFVKRYELILYVNVCTLLNEANDIRKPLTLYIKFWDAVSENAFQGQDYSIQFHYKAPQSPWSFWLGVIFVIYHILSKCFNFLYLSLTGLRIRWRRTTKHSRFIWLFGYRWKTGLGSAGFSLISANIGAFRYLLPEVNFIESFKQCSHDQTNCHVIWLRTASKTPQGKFYSTNGILIVYKLISTLKYFEGV